MSAITNPFQTWSWIAVDDRFSVTVNSWEGGGEQSSSQLAGQSTIPFAQPPLRRNRHRRHGRWRANDPARLSEHRWSQDSSKWNKEIRDATFSVNPITGTAPHHRVANNYRRLPADYDSLPTNYRHLFGFHYQGCLPLLAISRQGWSIYRRLPPLMTNYRHAGNAVMKSCTSKRNVFAVTRKNIMCCLRDPTEELFNRVSVFPSFYRMHDSRCSFNASFRAVDGLNVPFLKMFEVLDQVSSGKVKYHQNWFAVVIQSDVNKCTSLFYVNKVWNLNYSAERPRPIYLIQG